MHLLAAQIFVIMRKGRKPSQESGAAVPYERSADSIFSSLDMGSILDALKNKSHLDRLSDRDPAGSETDANVETLNSMNKGNGIYENISAYIDMMSQGGYFTPEIRDQLRQLLFQMMLNQDQRQFDLQQLADSRLYNSPTNELARLMGAGISRDAAIQMLSGAGSGAGSAGTGVAGSAGVGAPAVPQTSGTFDLQKIQTGISGAVEIVGALCNLMTAGVSFAQGVEQVKSMQFQNFMNQETLGAYRDVNEITKLFQQLQLDGIIEPADIDSLQNANDAYKWLLDHADTNGVKPIFQSGAFQRVFGSTMGREMFNNNWHQVRDSRDYGRQLDQFIRQNELQNDLRSMDLNQSYVDFHQSIYDLLMKKPELYAKWQEVFTNAVRYEQEEYQRDIMGTNAYLASIKKRVATKVFEDRVHGGISDDSGIDLLSFEEWYSLKQAWIQSMTKYDYGDQYWVDYFKSHVRTANALQFLRENQAELAKIALDTEGPNPSFATIMQLIKIMTDAGAWQAVDAVVGKPASTTLDAFGTFDPIKPR